MRQHCDAIEAEAQRMLIENPLGTIERVGRPVLTVLPGPRLKYSVRLRFHDVARGDPVHSYRFAFDRWREIVDSRTRLVYRKTVDGHDYEATIRLEEVGRLGERGYGYVVDASLETRSPPP